MAAILIAVVTVKAQSPLFYNSMNGTLPAFRQFNDLADTNSLRKKWFLTKHAGISAGFVAFNAANSTFLSVPIGVQINRRLTNTLYAFAGVSSMAIYSPYFSTFYQPGINKNNSFMSANSFGTFSTAHIGMMYINSERTFSISGSFGVSRSTYNDYSPFYAPANTARLRNNK